MVWRVLKDGAMLEVVDPGAASAAGSTGPTHTRIYGRGHVLREPLAPDLIERWERGDAHLRSVVERVEIAEEVA